MASEHDVEKKPFLFFDLASKINAIRKRTLHFHPPTLLYNQHNSFDNKLDKRIRTYPSLYTTHEGVKRF